MSCDPFVMVGGECNPKILKICKQVDKNVDCLYFGFFLLAVLVSQCYDLHWSLGVSSLLTLSVALQFFGLICLHAKVGQGSVSGVSMKALICQALVYACRLTSTTWFKGYIPVDDTGDYLYQVLDLLTLLMVLRIIFCCAKSHRHTYQRDHDTMDIKLLLLVCLVLAVLVHPDLNEFPLFDTLWATSLYIDVVAMAPQLWMMSKSGGAEAVTSHYVAAIALSRAVNLIFWYNAYWELAPEDGGTNIAGYAIVLAHILQVLLMADFFVLYLKSCWNRLCGAGGRTFQKVFVEI